MSVGIIARCREAGALVAYDTLEVLCTMAQATFMSPCHQTAQPAREQNARQR